MGDPKRQKKNIIKPSHPWEKERIEEEALLLKEYGLKNKEELQRMLSILRNFTRRAKSLATSQGEQAEIEKKQLLIKLKSIGILKENADLNDVLELKLKDILERRLQTLVYRKSLSNSIKQARHFVVHEHILVGNKKMKAPSYIVTTDEEDKISFSKDSTVASQLKEKVVNP